MMRLSQCWLLCSALWMATPSVASAKGIEFHWQDDFTTSEQTRLRGWIEQTDQALVAIVGPLPYTRHVYFHRLDDAREPVPWAHTQRSPHQGVHLHVDPSYSMHAFLADWTAPHELSHLVLPYLGEENAWVAEGFASYMQYQVMASMGILSASEIERRYQQRVSRAQARFNFPAIPFARAAPQLRAQRQYPTMYWGGAVFFLAMDKQLKTQDVSLMETLRQFTACCRYQARGLTAVISTLDRLSGTGEFSKLLEEFRTTPGFPEI